MDSKLRKFSPKRNGSNGIFEIVKNTQKCFNEKKLETYGKNAWKKQAMGSKPNEVQVMQSYPLRLEKRSWAGLIFDSL